jgi:hypothetical protein
VLCIPSDTERGGKCGGFRYDRCGGDELGEKVDFTCYWLLSFKSCGNSIQHSFSTYLRNIGSGDAFSALDEATKPRRESEQVLLYPKVGRES